MSTFGLLALASLYSGEHNFSPVLQLSVFCSDEQVLYRRTNCNAAFSAAVPDSHGDFIKKFVVIHIECADSHRKRLASILRPIGQLIGMSTRRITISLCVK
jgi:hypothetical protein